MDRRILLNETHIPTFMEDRIGTYCTRDIPCVSCAYTNTPNCPNPRPNKDSKPFFPTLPDQSSV